MAVWHALDRSPGYADMVALLQRLFGGRIADELRALFTDAGIAQVEIRTLDGAARFPSLQSWVHTDVKSWTLADKIDEVQYQSLRRAAGRALQSYVQPDGTVTFAVSAHVVTATRP